MALLSPCIGQITPFTCCQSLLLKSEKEAQYLSLSQREALEVANTPKEEEVTLSYSRAPGAMLLYHTESQEGQILYQDDYIM